MKRELPHDLGAERALIASLILNQNTFDKITDLKISEEDFYDKRIGAIFKAIYEIILLNRPVDYVTVSSMLSDLNKLEFIGGNYFLTSIVDDHMTDVNVYGYAMIVKEKSTLRNIIETTIQIANDGYEHEGHVKEFISNCESKFFKLTNQSKVNKSKSLKELVKMNLKTLEGNSRAPGEVEGLSTGYPALDKYLLGLRSGQLIIIGARPGMGKSALALNLAVNSVEQSGLPAIIFTLEMQCDELSMRILSSMSKVDGKKIKTKNFGPHDLSNISKAASKMANMPIFIDDTSAINLMEITSICRKKKAEEGLGIVVIDYLQLMGVNKSVPREQQISEISRGLKAMAKDLGIPVIALSQLNRVAETTNKSFDKGGSSSKRPTSSNLRESGAIEQDADAILLIYRDDYYNKEHSKEPGVAEIIITKNRGGDTGTVKLGWVGAVTSFENLKWEGK
ncbi:MAG: replicative DNA helicase [Bacteriovorax sp.]|nr:replicative DNA helicase [Bacteriovorax sp.]